MEDAKKKWLVFISHSHVDIDTWVARQIASKLEAEGIEPFLDQLHIHAGEDFEARIIDALKRVNESLVLFSPRGLVSKFVWMEIGGALLRGIPINRSWRSLMTDSETATPSFTLSHRKLLIQSGL